MGRPLVLGVLLAALLPAAALAQSFHLERVASGLARPVYVTAAPGDADRVFILEQHTGAIRILDLASGALLPAPFLVVPGIATRSEQGLLGLAFHPDYASNGFFYVYVTISAGGDTRVRRYQVSADPNLADAGSATPVLGFAQPQQNHNAGWIGFDDEGLLYIASGDGGGGDDNGIGHTPGIGNSLDVSDNLLGKILRIDVDGDDFPADPDRNYAIPPDNPFAGGSFGDPEIWLYGLRNPWRSSFDRATGDLYIGDVGQRECEEINVHPADAAPGWSFGWRRREGTVATPTGGVGGPMLPGTLQPIMDYPHRAGRCSNPGPGFIGVSVTGGYVYRGPIAELQGRYFFADYGTARLWSLVWEGNHPATFDGDDYSELTDHTGDPRFTPDAGSIDTVSSFGEDAPGNLYVVDLDGEVFRLPEPGAGASQLAAAAALGWLARRRRIGGRRPGR